MSGAEPGDEMARWLNTGPDSSDYDDLSERELAHEVLDAEELAATYKARGWRWR